MHAGIRLAASPVVSGTVVGTVRVDDRIARGEAWKKTIDGIPSPGSGRRAPDSPASRLPSVTTLPDGRQKKTGRARRPVQAG
ncbi:hypothetical protein M8R20_43110 [Pseudomonas sp. R2.Fl]|nr:hypothetical protein [Pseudomonas sp. R2.Fl]